MQPFRNWRHAATNLKHMLRFLTAGESHGPALVVTVEGLPAGLPVTVEDLGVDLARRRLGYGRGPRQRFEVDKIEIIGGVRHGETNKQTEPQYPIKHAVTPSP